MTSKQKFFLSLRANIPFAVLKSCLAILVKLKNTIHESARCQPQVKYADNAKDVLCRVLQKSERQMSFKADIIGIC